MPAEPPGTSLIQPRTKVGREACHGRQPESSPKAPVHQFQRQSRRAGNGARRQARPGVTQEDGVSEFGEWNNDPPACRAPSGHHPRSADAAAARR